MADSYVGRVEYAASGLSRLEIDDLDSPNWIGTSVGPWVITRSEQEVWEVGVILLDGPRAWQYASAARVIRRGGDGGVTVHFEGKTAFAPLLSADDVLAAQQRVESLRQRHARTRMPISPDDDTPVFENPTLSILERTRRDGDDLRDYGPPGESLWPMRPNTSRLALDHGGTQLFVGEGSKDDSIYFAHREQMGGGDSSFPRSVLASHGAAISWSSGSGRSGVSVHGVVPDEVIAVRVNGQHAVMGENVFLIVLDEGAAPDEIVLTTATGEHEIRYGPPPEL